MPLSPTDVRALALAGSDALREGDAFRARELFEQLVAQGPPDAEHLLGVAHACFLQRDMAGALAAVDRSLTLAPRYVLALIFKADLLAAQGDDRAASSHYQFAVQAASTSAELPPDLQREVERARTMVSRFAQKFEQFLVGRLQSTAPDGTPASARFTQSLDILLGRKGRYFQQPQAFYFAELPQIQFYDRSHFPWMDDLERATGAIQGELAEVLRSGAEFKPYVERNPIRPKKEESGMTDNPDWSAFYLWKNGQPVPENVARCPRTATALANIPFSDVANRSPSVLFSQLRPGARIPPHSGLVNTRLICHLPLIVPPGCGFRVGNDTRTPVEGKAWAFDDTIEHEAWNESDRTRVILLFEIWRPELSDDERTLVRTMFESIDEYTGQLPSWSI